MIMRTGTHNFFSKKCVTQTAKATEAGRRPAGGAIPPSDNKIIVRGETMIWILTTRQRRHAAAVWPLILLTRDKEDVNASADFT